MTKSPRVNNFSLSRDYLIIVGIIALGLIFLVSCLSFISYSSFNAEKNQNLITINNKIEKSLFESFGYVESLMDYTASQIEEMNNPDPVIIIQKLRNKLISNHEVQKIFSFSLFDWIDSNNLLFLTSDEGKIEKILDLSERSYIKKARIDPWKLHFNEPSFGTPTKQWIIPAGFGVTDHEGKFLGTIGMGFNISNLSNHIEQNLSLGSASYIILNEFGDIVLHSSDVRFNNQDDYFKKQSITELSQGIDAEFLKETITYKNITYSFCSIIKDTPFTILSGYNENLKRKELVTRILSKISGFIIMGFLLIFVFMLLRRMLVSPIILLSNAAEEIRSNNITKLSIKESNVREINILAEQLKRLIDYIGELKKTRDELKKSKSTIQAAHTQISEANQLLEARVEERTLELKKALEVKTEVLNNISHEVKTPIQGITAISNGLVEVWDKLSDAERKAHAKHVAMAAERLFSLMGNLLDLSKISAGKMIMNMEPADITVSIREIINECEMLYINKKPIKLVLNIQRKIETITVFDKERIIQVLRNLFANAIKFTSEGIIKANLKNKNNNILFELDDNGVGIPESELIPIFEPFIQSTRTKTTAGGTGLGLSICKEIINAHQGTIWAKNLKKGGSKFSFTLPIIASKIVNHEANEIAATPSPSIDQNLKIMIIDDEDVSHQSLKLILDNGSIEFTNYYSGIEALKYLKSNKNNIDIILLDLMMPDIHGLKVLEEIRNDSSLAHIKVIIQSGNYNIKDIEYIRSFHSTWFISKPYKKQDVEKIIIEALQK